MDSPAKSPLLDVFTSERLIYEPFDVTDQETIEFLYRELIRDPTASGMGSINTFYPQSKSSFTEMVQHWKENYMSAMVCLKPDGWDELVRDHGRTEHGKLLRGTPVGYIGLSPMPDVVSQHRSTRVGVSIATQQQGRGYGPEALAWLASWAFNYGNLHSLRLQTGSMNPRAIRAFKKAGFVEEGREREALYMGGQWHDIVSMSMLEHEWRARAKSAQKESCCAGTLSERPRTEN